MKITSADRIRRELQDSETASALTRDFIAHTVLGYYADALFHARRDAKLTQQDVAAKLDTKQPAITRMERDTSGATSLRRYVNFALACGQVPLVTLAPMDSVRKYLIAYPNASLGAEDYIAWQQEQTGIQTHLGAPYWVDSLSYAPAAAGYVTPAVSRDWYTSQTMRTTAPGTSFLLPPVSDQNRWESLLSPSQGASLRVGGGLNTTYVAGLVVGANPPTVPLLQQLPAA